MAISPYIKNASILDAIPATGLHIKSNTTDSTKVFCVTVNDSGQLSASEVVAAQG